MRTIANHIDDVRARLNEFVYNKFIHRPGQKDIEENVHIVQDVGFEHFIHFNIDSFQSTAKPQCCVNLPQNDIRHEHFN